MKKILLTAIIAFAALTSTQTFAQQGFGTNTPDKSSAVDIVSTKRGLLIPRLDLTSTTSAGPVTNPAQSLLVYNKNTAADVTPGFYYWENNKWVRVMSSNIAKTSSVIAGTTTHVTSAVSANDTNNTEYKVEVNESALKLQNIGGNLNPNQIVTGTDKQVLVTKVDSNGELVSGWVNPSEVIGDGIVVGDGLTKVENKISLGGNVDDTVTFNLGTSGAIKINNLPSLPENGAGAFNSNTGEILVMGADGIIKKASAESILSSAISNGEVSAKTLSTDGKIVIGNNEATSLANSVLVDTELKIKAGSIGTTDLANSSVTADKLNGGEGTDGRVAVSNADGTVTYQPLASTLGKTLTTDGKIVIGSEGVSSLQNAVLVDTNLKIKEGSITTTELAEDAITASKINTDVAGAGLKQNATTGALEVDLSANGIAKGLTTDNVIQITGEGATSTSSSTESLLKEIGLKIGENTITEYHIATGAVTSDEISNGTILPEDIKTGGNSKVIVTDASGNVTWIDQTALGNTVTAENGLTKTGNNIKLGGKLIDPTTKIDTNGNALAIEGLGAVAVENDFVVVQKDGVLKTVNRSISTSTSASLNVSSIAGYTSYVQEVNISATAGSTSFDINLPDAVAAKGQVINIKLANTTEVDGYVNIKSGTTELTYGSLPYQGWIIKSNGAAWIIVGRN